VDRISGQDWNALRGQLRVRGRTVGVMSIGTMGDRVFNASDMLFMAAVADQVAIAIDRARQFASEARTDHLTGLANRREFERVMEREVALAERHKRRLSLMMIDLDNLKRINDRLGHGTGDGALRLVAQQLQRVVRASDVCARVGGDEFAVAMPETDLDRARDVAVRLRRAVDHASLSMKASEHIEVSVGIAAWRPGQDWQAVYQASDEDLYEDKRRRKTVQRWQQEDQAPAIRVLGRGGGRRRASGA
jgi:diguanylate cyclase (GGDEF)-like protein